jgi:hypothetical protein
MEVVKTLVYYDMAIMTEVKHSKVHAPGDIPTNSFRGNVTRSFIVSFMIS